MVARLAWTVARVVAPEQYRRVAGCDHSRTAHLHLAPVQRPRWRTPAGVGTATLSASVSRSTTCPWSDVRITERRAAIAASRSDRSGVRERDPSPTLTCRSYGRVVDCVDDHPDDGNCGGPNRGSYIAG